MAAIIIYGPRASGKTRNADKFLKHYNKKRIVDDWDGSTSLNDDDLVLTNEFFHPRAFPSQHQAISIKDALAAIK